MKKKYFSQILCGVFFILMLLMVGNNRIYAAEAEVHFGENDYSIDAEEIFDVNITIKASGSIGIYQVRLYYDAGRMEYISGAEKAEDGIITLEGTGFGDEVAYTLEFKAVKAGEAGISVKDAQIYSPDDEAIQYTISSLATMPIKIDGEEDGELSFFEELLAENQAQTSDDTYGIETSIPIVGSISNTDGSKLYVVDLADYEPDIKLWDYKLVTDTYINQNLTYISDKDRNIRVILVMDENESFSFYAFKEETQSFYPVNEITSEGDSYYIMALNACQKLPDEMTDEERNSNTIFYAVKEDGTGGYYRYTKDGTLENWSGNKQIVEKENPENNHGRIIISTLVATVVFVAIIVIIFVYKLKGHDRKIKRRVRRKVKRQIDLFSGSVSDRKQYFFVIRELTSREIKRKYARSYLGIIWSVLNPLLMMIVMSMVFSYMFKRSIENFPLYYLTGSIFWSLFHDGTNHAMSALVDNKSLLVKAKLPRQTFVLSRMYTALVNFGYSCIPYVVMLVVFGVRPSWTMLLFPLDVLLTLLFATGVGYILSILYVFFADIKYLYSVFLRILLYLTAIFYPVTSLPDKLQTLIGYNPVYMSIYIARECMVYRRVPYYTAWVKLALAAALSCIVGWIVFNKKQNDVMQRI